MPAIDLVKLSELREQHAQLHDTYRGAASRARTLRQKHTHLVAEIVAGSPLPDRAMDLLALDAVKLMATSKEDLAAAGLDHRRARTVTAAATAAAKQAAEAQVLAAQVRASSALMQRINEYAIRFE